MIWSRVETPMHHFPVRMIGPNAAWECIFNTSGEPMADRCRRIDAAHGPRCNIWLSVPIDLEAIEWIWEWGAAQTLNGTLLKRLLSVRAEWSRR